MEHKFIKTETGCIVPNDMKLNKDGYFRCRIPHKGKGRGKLMMWHRYIWENTHGQIPAGYSLHHICHNRACCNIVHLELIDAHTHASTHNTNRYATRYNEAYKYWQNNKVTGTKLAEIFKVSISTTCRWIRLWKV